MEARAVAERILVRENQQFAEKANAVEVVETLSHLGEQRISTLHESEYLHKTQQKIKHVNEKRHVRRKRNKAKLKNIPLISQYYQYHHYSSIKSQARHDPTSRLAAQSLDV